MKNVIGITVLTIGIIMLSVVFYFSLISGRVLLSAGIGGLLSFIGLVALTDDETEEEEGGDQ